MWNIRLFKTKHLESVDVFPPANLNIFDLECVSPSPPAARWPMGESWVALSNVCLNSSFQLHSSPVFRLYSDIILYLDRLDVSYAVFHRFCQAWWNLYPVLRGSGAIKQPRLSFLLELGDIFFYRRLFFCILAVTRIPWRSIWHSCKKL